MAQPRPLVDNAATDTTGRHYSVLVATDERDVRAAQRLRYQVFAEELGARLPGTGQSGAEPSGVGLSGAGLDVDEFDAHCDHLVVRDETTGDVVGTYRMLPPGRSATLYSDTEFDLTALAGLRGSLVETGRSCVHPDHRTGAVVGLVWAGIARYLLLSGHTWLAGCASVPLADGGGTAAGVWDVVRHKHFAPAEYRVSPLRPWDVDAVPVPSRPVVPPLLRGYLRLGAWICGRPAYDPDFGVADFFVLLSLDRVDQRYLRFFLGES